MKRRYVFLHKDPLVVSEVNRAYDHGYRHGMDDAAARHTVTMIEVTYPHALGGEMLDGYSCNDQQMAQAVVTEAAHNATILERERLREKLTSYFALTRFSVEHEGAEENTEWDAGFQAAIAILGGDK